MTALITVKRGKRIIARCDERCYEAQVVGEECTCACGGELHGLGAVEAANKIINCQARLTAIAMQLYGYSVHVEFNVSAYQSQLPLF